MGKAAIYVRTSSEAQAEKASPEEQERDCQQVAAREGLEVVAVFRDVTKYRVGRKLVEPSGTRADRPGLVAMMAAAGRGEFDTILAWKEDRLYRGLRAMLFVLDEIQAHKLRVLLARETFDERLAPLKAWVAGMELESLKERMTMGVKARLRAGKANTGQDRYGYRREGERIVIVEEEAVWVRQIFTWYLERVPILEIRRRLIEAGAPQKGSSIPRKMAWARTSIQAVLRAAEEYATGVKRMSRKGEVFELVVEPIISVETWGRVMVLREEYKTWPAHNVKRDYLIRGLLYCSCGYKWGARMTSYKAKGVKRKTPIGTYFCRVYEAELRHPDCPKTIGSRKADAEVWQRVEAALRDPELFLAGARRRVEKLQVESAEMERERERIAGELGLMAEERQWVITQARKRRITDSDMEEQLAAIGLQEHYLRREMAGLGVAEELAGLEGWEDVAREYLADLLAGVDALDEDGATEEEQAAIFNLRREVVETLVEKVEIGRGRELVVTMKIDALALLRKSARTGDDKTSEGIRYLLQKGGIYSRRRSSPLRHQFAASGSPSPPACQSAHR